MGNCLQCFQSSSDQTGSTIITQAAHCQTTNIDSCGRAAGSAIDRSSYTDRPGETDELLSASPLMANNGDTKRNSFKKSIVLLNGNANNLGDIITTVLPLAVKESHEVSDNTLNLLFEEYKDPYEDAILSDGIERLCRDLCYQPDEFPILVLAWCLDASQMCRFTKMEFIEGLHKMSADTIDTIRLRLEQTIELMKTDSDMFKQLYRFTFRFGLEPDHRILSLEMAIILWRLVFTLHKPELLDRWLYFLEQHPNIRGIPKDTWNMFLNFSEQCDINNYDDTEAWPSLFDDFVDYEKSRLSGNLDETNSKSPLDDVDNANNNNDCSHRNSSSIDVS